MTTGSVIPGWKKQKNEYMFFRLATAGEVHQQKQMFSSFLSVSTAHAYSIRF